MFFRTNDYEKANLSNKSLSKDLALFKKSGQQVLTPATTSFGPHLKTNKQAKTSVYYLAPHNLNEYFASEILLRIGIITPKCRILSTYEEEGTPIPYGITVVSFAENHEINNSELFKIVSSNFYNPLLIKQNSKIFLYGTPNGSNWEITPLQADVFGNVEFKKPGDRPFYMDAKFVTPSIYKEIALKKAHTPPLIASKNLEGFIPIKFVRRHFRSGERKKIEHVGWLENSEYQEARSLIDRYELDIQKQVIYDHVEKKIVRVSGSLFSSDIAATLIGDGDFQTDGHNLGVVKIGSRFYAAAIDKERAKFEGKNYETLAKELSNVITCDFLFKSRTDEQVMAVVYQIAQSLVLSKDNQCDFDRIFSNPRVHATSQLFTSPDERCANVKKTARSIIEYYKNKYGENYLEKYSKREILRNQIAFQVLANIDVPDCSYDFLMNNIIEDLRGPFYRHLFADQSTRLISDLDLENSELLKAVLFDVLDENQFSVRNESLTPVSNCI